MTPVAERRTTPLANVEHLNTEMTPVAERRTTNNVKI
jgi:hypothetical protein